MFHPRPRSGVGGLIVRQQMRRDDIAGTEFDWVAADEAGLVGLFSTSGYGPVPAGVLDQRGKHSAMIEAIEDRAEIPGWADLLTYTGPVPVFVYDWTVHSGPYSRAQCPRGGNPMKVNDLPEQLQPFVIRFGFAFEGAETIEARAIENQGEQAAP